MRAFYCLKIIYYNRKKADASKKQAGKLFSVGIHTIGEFAAAAPAWLKGIVGFHNDIDFDAYTLLWQIRHCSTKSNEVVSID